MIEIAVPGFGQLRLEHAVFDVNGTLAVDGQPDPEIGPRLSELAGHLQIHLLSALTHGNRAALEQAFGQAVHTIEPGDEAEQKAEYVRQLGADGCAAIGNGRNDRLMLAVAAVGIAVIDREGLAADALRAADVVVPGAREAIELLLTPRRLLATLRG